MTAMDSSSEPDLDFPKFAATILRNSEVSNVELSDLTAFLIAEAARCLKFKKSERDQLSSTTYALAARLHLQQHHQELLDEEKKLLIVLAPHFEALDRIADTFFERTPDFARNVSDYPDEKEAAGIVLGTGLRSVLSRLHSSGLIEADRLLHSLIEDVRTGLSERLNRQGSEVAFSPEADSPAAIGPHVEATREAIEPPPTGSAGRSAAGRHVRIVREATLDELGLNVTDYAKALATILRVSEGEFSFALFGKWGSGKTTLLRIVKPLLEKPEDYRRAVIVPDKEKYADLTYKVVLHNAWKYRTAPESWIYLYRSLSTAIAASTSGLERWATALRTKTGRHGYGGLLIALVLLAVSMAPITAKLRLLGLLVSATSVSAVFYLVMVWMGSAKKVKDLFDRNLRLVGPDDNLGMLALIGDDVRALLKSWTKDAAAASEWRQFWPLIVVVCVSALWAFGLLGPVLQMPDMVASMGYRVAPREGGPVDLFRWAVWALWTLCAAALVCLPAYAANRRPDKVLLVVDDLDRCEPREMLTVIENVRLLLDDPEVNARMQVLMLVDEGVLNHAIASRYDSMIRERSKFDEAADSAAYSTATSDIVAEQTEKLFACHLRMARLSDEDVAELVEKLAGRENQLLKEAAAAARREAEREALRRGQEIVKQAENDEKILQSVYNDLISGKPRPRRDEDAPSERQPPMQIRIRAGVDFYSKTADEKARDRAENATIDTYNNNISRMTPGQRAESNPELVRSLDVAKARRKEAEEQLKRFPSERPADELPPFKAPFETGDVRFSDAEIQLLRGFVPSYFRTIGRRPSPRSIKALLFKLQLARLLLQLRYPGLRDEKNELVRLLDAFQKETSNTSKDSGPYALIVRQVL